MSVRGPSSPPHFGDLRSALTQRPSARQWELVTGLLWRWPDQAELHEVALPYASQQLRAWPMPVRVAPRTWLEALARDDERLSTALFSLCACVEYTFWQHDALLCHEVAHALATREHGRAIRGLWFDSALPRSLEGVTQALKAGPHLAQVTQLGLALPPEQMIFAREDAGPWSAGLTHLWLKRGRLNAPRWEDWLRAHGALRHLCLVGQDLGQGARQWERLLQWQGWPALERLHLFGCFVDDQADGFVSALAQAQASYALKTLDLGGCQLSDRGVQALSRSGALGSLEVLALHLNPLTSQALELIWRTDRLPKLRTLILPPQAARDAHRVAQLEDAGVSVITTEDPRPIAPAASVWFD